MDNGGLKGNIYGNKEKNKKEEKRGRYGKEAIEFRENSIVVKIPFNWINVVGNKVGNKVGNRKDKGLTNNRQLFD